MKFKTLFLLSTLLLTVSARAEKLPGFSIEKIAGVPGYLTSIVVSPSDEIYVSVTDGRILRLDGLSAVEVAKVPTANEGNAVLLGIAFRGADELIAHYVRPDLSADVIGSVNVRTGEQSVIADFPCFGGSTCSSEHHGGNPIVGLEQNIYFGIGDYGGGPIAQDRNWNAGKMFRIDPFGNVEMYAIGMRNPFDLVYDATTGNLLVGDNGPVGEDEIHAVAEGDNCGWPYTAGNQPAVPGMVPPIYTFRETVAPTGMLYVRGPMPMPANGLIVASYVTRALYYFPDVTRRPLGEPVVLIKGETPLGIIDLAQKKDGTIIFATGTAIYRLRLPTPGDANGDGRIDARDLAIIEESFQQDGPIQTVYACHGPESPTWGADVNLDGVIDVEDAAILARMVTSRRRPAGRQ